MSMNFDLETMRRSLIAMREFFGADTPEGHRCSNLIEQRENFETAVTPDQKDNLRKLMEEQIVGLEKLKAQRVTH